MQKQVKFQMLMPYLLPILRPLPPPPPPGETNSLEDRQKDMLDKNSIVTGTGDYNYSIISLLVQSF